MISINIEIYANGWKLYRYRYVYIYTHANAHGLQTSHHQDLRQFEQLNRNMPSRHSPLMSHQKSSLFGNIS